MVGRERSCDAIAFRELAGNASIFAGDDIGAREQFERAQGDIAEISNRCGYQIETGCGLGRLDCGS